jgi:hypothetical protein
MALLDECVAERGHSQIRQTGSCSVAGRFELPWVGRTFIQQRLTGAKGLIRLGDYVMPRQVTFVVEGEKGDPDLEVSMEVRDGRPQVVDYHASAKPDGRALRTSDLQALALDRLVVNAYAKVAMHAVYDPERNVTEMSPVMDEQEIWNVIHDVEEAVKAPRRGVTTAELEQVAQVYKEASSAPTAAVRTILGYDSERTAARRVQQAREAGLLPPLDKPRGKGTGKRAGAGSRGAARGRRP